MWSLGKNIWAGMKSVIDSTLSLRFPFPLLLTASYPGFTSSLLNCYHHLLVQLTTLSLATSSSSCIQLPEYSS